MTTMTKTRSVKKLTGLKIKVICNSSFPSQKSDKSTQYPSNHK